MAVAFSRSLGASPAMRPDLHWQGQTSQGPAQRYCGRVGRALESVGFKVTPLSDASRRKMLAAVQAFAKATGCDGVDGNQGTSATSCWAGVEC
jgi:hypothetical protein